MIGSLPFAARHCKRSAKAREPMALTIVSCELVSRNRNRGANLQMARGGSQQ